MKLIVVTGPFPLPVLVNGCVMKSIVSAPSSHLDDTMADLHCAFGDIDFLSRAGGGPATQHEEWQCVPSHSQENCWSSTLIQVLCCPARWRATSRRGRPQAEQQQEEGDRPPRPHGHEHCRSARVIPAGPNQPLVVPAVRRRSTPLRSRCCLPQSRPAKELHLSPLPSAARPGMRGGEDNGPLALRGIRVALDGRDMAGQPVLSGTWVGKAMGNRLISSPREVARDRFSPLAFVS